MKSEEKDLYGGEEMFFYGGVKRGFLILFFCLFVVSCLDQKPDLSKPERGTLGRLSFQFPKNWKITQREEVTDFKSVMLDTSSGGILILKSYPVKKAETLQSFAKEFSSCASGEGTLMKMEAGEVRSEGAERLTEIFQMKLLGQGVEFQRIYEKRVVGERCVFFILQETTDVISEAEKGLSLSMESLSEWGG